MKKMKKHVLSAAILFAFSLSTFAQVTLTATASASIVSPIAMTKGADMNFGNVAVNLTGGTVVLPPAAPSTRVATGVTLPAVTGTVSAAAFTVTGTPDYVYVITLPSGNTVIDNNLAGTMNVNGWTTDATTQALRTLTGGTSTFHIGATLNVAASQEAGTYTSDIPFSVTVNYQ